MKNYARGQNRSQIVFFDDSREHELERAFNLLGPHASAWFRTTLPGPWRKWLVIGEPYRFAFEEANP